MGHHRFAFCASTGRTATMFLASTLNALPGVLGLHEGHVPGDPPTPRLPLINLENRKCWHEPAYAEQVVALKRDAASLASAAGDAELLVDVAFYNAPLLIALSRQYPDATLLVVFRRCEGFVRSATIVNGEDRQPAGWPDRAKALTDREKFIALGRLQPAPGSDEAAVWPAWSAIQRNIWLWHHVNSHLLRVTAAHANCHALYYEELAAEPKAFWTACLRDLSLLSTTNLATCVARSAQKLNQRPSYEIGPIDTWNEAEHAQYDRLARPLERELYE